MIKILVSACLLGQKVRYDGKDNYQAHVRLRYWVELGRVIPVCPECLGGLPVPRPAAEIQAGATGNDVIHQQAKITTITGKDVTAEYLSGARKTLKVAQDNQVMVAILKARSPSCGSTHIYDGTFSNNVIDGIGVTAALLVENGIQVFNEAEIDRALDMAEDSH